MYQRIRDLREDRDLMQKDLAAYLKCTQVCYSNYEMGSAIFQQTFSKHSPYITIPA